MLQSLKRNEADLSEFVKTPGICQKTLLPYYFAVFWRHLYFKKDFQMASVDTNVKSNRKSMNRNWRNQKPNHTLRTKITVFTACIESYTNNNINQN